MLKITIPSFEGYNDSTNEFVDIPSTTIQLEHSLVSVAKWEAKWNKPFMSKNDKTEAEIIDYIKCMTLTQNVDPKVYSYIPSDVIVQISKYIDSPMTATTFSEAGSKKNTEIITSEIIYYWMISLNIPFECQKWHLNRLLTLIRVCSIKNAPQKSMSKQQILQRNKALNEARKAQMHTRG